MKINNIVRKTIAPMIYNRMKKFIRGSHKINPKKLPPLFDGDELLFKEALQGSRVYGEYGCGISTLWVAQNTKSLIRSVDTDNTWIQLVKDKISHPERLNIHHADLGEVGDWGKPVSYQHSDRFSIYTDWMWKKQPPDTVLIDGRFRVCCFLTTLLHGAKGTKIIFDDYVPRPFYHYVEKFIPKKKTSLRQALFVIPDKKTIKIAELKKDIEKFRMVFD